MAGLHLYSKEYGVAAIGNIVTDEKYRGRGFAKSVTASLCRDLWGEIKYIGLNVKIDNTPAIKAYERIGLSRILRLKSSGRQKAADNQRRRYIEKSFACKPLDIRF